MPLPPLNAPLAWDPANPNSDANVSALLDDLQANIVKGHGRAHTRNLFFGFDPARAVHIRAMLRQFSWQMKSARQLALDAFARRNSGPAGGPDGGTVRCLLLSFAGYEALEIADKAPGARKSAFRLGMAARRDELNDPPSADWDPLFRKALHALVLIADSDVDRLQEEQDSIAASFAAVGATLLGVEIGHQQFNARKQGIEHFGYVDGRSQPLFLQSDIEQEKNETDGIDVWDPAFGPDLVLATRGTGASKKVLGSYLVFRKLEQDVKRFKDTEGRLATSLGLKDADRELAGALIVGRFEDGTPVVLRKRDGFGGGVPNNFDYDEDPAGIRCPLHAHVRKTNPRGSGGGETHAAERRHLMARRGITYGKRKPNHSDQPRKNVGLLFMSYQASIEEQFEFTQGAWANSDSFPIAMPPQAVGIDPLIGQGAVEPGTQQCPVRWGDPATTTKPANFAGVVKLKGGEYFFAPTLSALRTL